MRKKAEIKSVDDYIKSIKKLNKGEKQKYHIEEAHKVIITIEIWNKEQEIRKMSHKKMTKDFNF